MSTHFLPPAVIGVIGGGQLGMMLVREAQRMGYRSIVWDPDPDCPARRLADQTLTAPFRDLATAQQFVNAADVMTYEFENIDPEVVSWLEQRKEVYPGSRILRVAQHRKNEKEEVRRGGYPTVEFRTALSNEDLRKGVQEIGFPALVKTATSGYDGKGQVLLRKGDDLNAFLLGREGKEEECVIEQFVDLQREVSVIAIRSKNGEITTLPLAENFHVENILHTTIVPARVLPEVEQEALRIGISLAETMNIIGLMCVEMFVTNDDVVLVNELAPRPHNSGHYSLDACDISQFEALVRTMCGLSVHQPRLQSPCAMVNLLGRHFVNLDVASVHRLKGAKLHLYGKRRMEAKRKMGHVTIVGESAEEVEGRLARLYALMGEEQFAGPVLSNSPTMHATNTER